MCGKKTKLEFYMSEIEKDLNQRFWINALDGKFMLYDRNTGNVHFCSDQENLLKMQKELSALPESKTIFMESKDNSFKINLSTVCNLHCDYCFRDKESHICTDVEAAKKIIDWILDVYARGFGFYSFALNMTSEALFELEKLQQIKAYLDERLNICFDLKEVTSVEVGRKYLSCFDSDLIGDLGNYVSAKNCVNKLNDLLSMRNLKDYFSVPEGMVIPEWERTQLENIDGLTERDVILANRRFLEVLFPETFKLKANYVLYVCTNGTICSDEVISFLKEIGLKRICVSLDGPASVQDKHRYFYNGNGSFVPIMKNIRKFKAAGFEIEIAAVITRDFLKPLRLVEFFKEIGADAVGMNVVRAGKGASLDLDDAKNLLSGYRDLFNRIFDDAVMGDYSLIRLLQNDICFAAVKHVLSKTRLLKRCKWNEELVFDSKGNVYSCDYFIGKKEFLRGSIESNKLKEIGSGKLFVEEREPCKDCWCKYMCGGTCFHNSYVKTGDLAVAESVECFISKGLRELGMELIHKLVRAGVNLFEFGKYLGFQIDSLLNFTKEFTFQNGLLHEFKGTLVEFKNEMEKVISFLKDLNVQHKEEIYISVEGIESFGENKLLKFKVMIPTLKEIDEQRLSSTNYKVIRNYSSGHCISMKSKSNDDEMSVVKDLIYGFVEKFKVPVKGNLVYKGPVDVFTGEREEIIDVYLCQTENVI